MTTTKLIAQKTLTDAHFLSASEQAGPGIGQPTPNSANTGQFKLLTSSAAGAADFTFSGTTTANGAGDGTTIVDTSELKWFGDSFLIDSTVTINSGAASGESKTASANTQSTGTVTTAAFSAQIVSGVTYTITISLATRDFNVELVGSGEAGAATFKWNHDGATWLGRSALTSGTWNGGIQVADDMTQGDDGAYFTKAKDGTIVCAYTDDTVEAVFKTSTDNGLTWSAAASLGSSASDVPVTGLITLESGRILASAEKNIMYSDDNGSTWTTVDDVMGNNIESIAQHDDGKVYAVYVSSGIQLAASADEGANWVVGVTEVADDANTQQKPKLINPKNSTYALFCVYESDEDSLNDFEIKGAGMSKTDPTTWTNSIAVIDFVGDMTSPSICRDVNGDLYCSASDSTSNNIEVSYSTDDGATWTSGATNTILDDANNLQSGNLCQVDGHSIWSAVADGTNGTIKLYRRGEWTAFSANACPVADRLLKHDLVCNVDIQWFGGSGIASDAWDFDPAYNHGMKNIIIDSPSKEWRSTTDGAQYIVIDLGANVGHYADGIALFGINWRDGDIQANTSDSWGSPAVSQVISSDLTTAGVCDSADTLNSITDAALLSGYSDHQLSGGGYYVRGLTDAGGGSEAGNSYKILTNIGDEIFLDTTSALDFATGDTFAIFQNHISVTFTGGVFRYWRIAIDAQDTAEEYLKIGTIVLGRTMALSRTYAPGYGDSVNLNITPLSTPAGGIHIIKNNEPTRGWALNWQASLDTQNEVRHLTRYLSAGENIAFIPDAATMTDCYLTKNLKGVQFKHWGTGARAHFSLALREVI